VQAFIGIVATVATVIHLTFGCCAHPCHFTGHGKSCRIPARIASTGCCHHGHGHHSQSEKPQQDAASWGQVASHGQDCHHCSGCSCTATVSGKVTPPMVLPLVTYLGSSSNPAHSCLTTAELRLIPDPFAYAGLRPHSIFERFLI